MINSYTEAVTLAKQGKEEAFAYLMHKTRREKFYIAVKYMKNETEADDVLQDAYLKAWQKLDTLEDPEKFPGWLGQIVANTALEALRRKRPITFSDMSGENDEGEEFVYDIQDEDISRQPELAYTDKERSELIRGMIDGLSDDQRLCVMMFYIQGLSVKEIAGSLGCSENTVKSRLNYGRKNIKASAEALEKKGYKFFGIAPVPLLYFLIRAEAMSQGVELVAPQLAPLGAASVQPTVQPQSAAPVEQSTAAQPQPAAAQPQAAAPVEQPVAPQPAGSAAASGGMASSSVGGVASAGGAIGKSFFATLGGKIAITIAGLAVVGGLGFGGYQLLSHTQPETTAEAPAASGQAADNIDEPLADEPTATEAPTPEPTPMPYDQMYVDYLNEHDEINIDQLDPEMDGDFGYSLIPLDDDEIPEMVVRYHDTFKMGEDYWYSPWYLDVMTIEDGEVVKLDTDIVTEGWQDGLSLVDSTGDFRYVPSQGHIYADLSGHTTGIGERTLDWEMDKVTHTLLLNVEEKKSTQPDSTPIEFVTEKKVMTPGDQSDAEENDDEKEESIYKDEFVQFGNIFKDGNKLYYSADQFPDGGYMWMMDVKSKKKPKQFMDSVVEDFTVMDGYMYLHRMIEWGEYVEPPYKYVVERMNLKTKKTEKLFTYTIKRWDDDKIYVKNDRIYYTDKNHKTYSRNLKGKDKKRYKGKIKPGKHSPVHAYGGDSKFSTFDNKYKISGNTLKRGKRKIYKSKSGINYADAHDDTIVIKSYESSGYSGAVYIYMDKNGKHKRIIMKGLVEAS